MTADGLPPGFAVGVARVIATEWVAPGTRQLRFEGEAIARMDPGSSPAPAVRLLIPPAGHDVALPVATLDGLVFPPGGAPPTPRTFTIRRLDRDRCTLDVQVLTGHAGVASEWAAAAGIGAEVGLAGPKLFAPLPTAPQHVLLGDTSAAPAIDAIVESLRAGGHTDVHAVVEPRADAARLVDAVRAIGPRAEASVWIAGEAAMVRAVRERIASLACAPAHLRACGYWRRRTTSTELDDALLRVTQRLIADDDDLARLDEFALNALDD